MSSINILPVEEPKKSLIPATCFSSILFISFILSFVPPNINEKFAKELSEAMLILFSNSFREVVFGNVFGISKYDVTPPAIAALDSDLMSPL